MQRRRPIERIYRMPLRARARAVRSILLAGLVLVAVGSIPATAEAHIYWTNQSSKTIGRAGLDGGDVNQGFLSVSHPGGNGPTGMAIDSQHIYWAFNGLSSGIGRANLDGTGVSTNWLPVSQGGGPTSVAVDSSHVYFTTPPGVIGPPGFIGRANLDGTGVDLDFITAPADGVAVDANHIYWTNDPGSIGRANLDGTGVDQNFITGAKHPARVAVDASHVYWTNVDWENGGGTSTMGRANLDGTAVNQSFISGATYPDGMVAIATGPGHVYWTNGRYQNGNWNYYIGRANLDGSGVDQSFITGANGAGGIAVDSLGPPPRLSIANAMVSEGDSGQSTVTLTVSADRVATQPLGFHYAASDGSATQPSDYQATSGNSSIPTGQSSTTITVPVNGDTINENDETVNLDLSAPTNAEIGDGHGVLTIRNDDPLPVVSIADAATVEGELGQSNAQVSVSLSAASSKTVTVNYATSDATATQPADYLPSSGTLTFSPGQTAKPVTVVINSDSSTEGSEIVNVDLVAPTQATIGDGHAILTIDDPIDTVAPNTKITKKPNGKIKTKKKSIKVKVSFKSDENATFKCKLDEKNYKTCTSPYAPKVKSKLGKGMKHKISIKALDEAGNVGMAVGVSFKVIRKR